MVKNNNTYTKETCPDCGVGHKKERYIIGKESEVRP